MIIFQRNLLVALLSLFVAMACQKKSGTEQDVLDANAAVDEKALIDGDQRLTIEGQEAEEEVVQDPVDEEDQSSGDQTVEEEIADTQEDQEEEVDEPQGFMVLSGADDSEELPSEPENKIITMDETDAFMRGEWKHSQVIKGYTNDGYHHSLFDGEKKSVVFKLNQKIEVSGYYVVKAHWTAHPNRATNAKIRIVFPRYDDEGQLKRKGRTVTVNQRHTNAEGNYIGTYYFHRNIDKDPKDILNRWQKIRMLANAKTNGYVIADGMTIEWLGAELPEKHMAQESPITLDTTSWEHVRKRGDWKTSRAISGFDGEFYLHDMNGVSLQDEEERKNIRYAPRFAEAGQYEIYVKFPSHGNRGNPLYVIRSYNADADKVKRHKVRVDQSTNEGKDEDGWLKLVHTSKKGVETSSFYFAEGQSFKKGALILRRDAHTDGYVIADSVKFVKID